MLLYRELLLTWSAFKMYPDWRISQTGFMGSWADPGWKSIRRRVSAICLRVALQRCGSVFCCTYSTTFRPVPWRSSPDAKRTQLGDGSKGACRQLPHGSSDYTPAWPCFYQGRSNSFSWEHPRCLTVEMINRLVFFFKNPIRARMTRTDESFPPKGSAGHAARGWEACATRDPRIWTDVRVIFFPPYC